MAVIVTTAGVDATKTMGTDYTVSNAGPATSGGNVVFGTAPGAGTILTIKRVVPYTQLAQYLPSASFPTPGVELSLDLLTMLTQQLLELFGRCIAFPPSEATSTNPVLAAAGSRALTTLSFDASGNLIPGAGVATPVSYFDPNSADVVIGAFSGAAGAKLHQYSNNNLVIQNLGLSGANKNIAGFYSAGLALQQIGQIFMMPQGDNTTTCGLSYGLMSAGSISFTNANITATSKLFVFPQETTITGFLKLSAIDRSAGTCTVTSSVGTDHGYVGVLILDSIK